LGGNDLPHLSSSATVGLLGIFLGVMPDTFKIFPPFFTLQAEQAVKIFVQVVSPPFDLGIK
jgi:hypothetical protein